MGVDTRPCVVHVVYRFDTGGLENGVVNLINHMPARAYRHCVVALTEVTDFRHRVQQDGVEFIALRKPPGQGMWLYPALFRLFRRLRPHIVHTRNLAALEAQVPAWLAGVPVRIHGEHGRDVGDLDGSNRRYQRIRKLYKPFVQQYVALSRDLEDYLVQWIGVDRTRIVRICNGVNTKHFAPASLGPRQISGCPFDPAKHWLIGTVGRMQAVKDQTLLARAFVQALAEDPGLRERARLVMVGDGPLRAQCLGILGAANLSSAAWLPGERTDVADVMRGLHAFVLPSLAEGISNTILEAMASGLPVVATDVGGNPDLVVPGGTGLLVAAGDFRSMALAIADLAGNPLRAHTMGGAGRERAVGQFSLEAMVTAYQSVYDRQLRRFAASNRSDQ